MIYKVTDRNLMSCRMDFDNAIQYKINEWAYPKIKNSLLLVFNNLHNARRFIERLGDYTTDMIWRCEVKATKRLNSLIHSGLDFERFWELYQKLPKKAFSDLFYVGTSSLVSASPEGTYGAAAVKLISEVK